MKKKKKRIALKIVLYTLLAVFAVVSCLASIWPFGMDIPNARHCVYGCLDGGKVVPDRAMIITDKMASVNNGSKIAVYGDFENSRYPAGMKHILVGNAVIDGNSVSLSQPDGTSYNIQLERAETIVWSLNYLGNVTYFIYNFRFVLWGVWAAVLILIVVFESTSPARSAKRYKKELLKTFDFYGEKYAEEDKDKDF